MEHAHTREASDVLAYFQVDPLKGLSEAEVLRNRNLYGKNEIPSEEGTPFWKLILKQFDDLLVKILIAAAFVSLSLALLNGETGFAAFTEPLVIVLILVANATVGVVTENNAEKAIEELKAYQAEVATVLRHGRLSILPATEIVPGDIVEVAVGCKIPADMRLVSILSSQLRVDQSILTGESCTVLKSLEINPSEKAVYQDKLNILFSGTVVTVGRARAVVIGTGSKTAIGKIKDAIAESSEEVTPLKKKLDEFGTLLSKVIAVICVLVWIVNIGHFNDPLHGGILRGAIHYFKIAVALAVAAIPEGLPAVVTTCLALGTKRMARLNAIVRCLPSVETLGCTTVICSDKTGTLTTNMMSVNKICVVQSPPSPPLSSPSTSLSSSLLEFDVQGVSYAPEGNITQGSSVIFHPADQPSLLHLAMSASLCNDACVHYDAEKHKYEKIGESTDVAMRVLAEKIGLPGFDSMPAALNLLPKSERVSYCNDYWAQHFTKLFTLEFSRDRKMMSVLCSRKGRQIIFSKGAFESVVKSCSHVLCNGETKREREGGERESEREGGGVDGDIVPLTSSLREMLERKMREFGEKQTLRCLALAMKPLPLSPSPQPSSSSSSSHSDDEGKESAREGGREGGPLLSPADEQGMIFIGLVGMLDPPREEVKASLQICKAAGIRVIVVTGDNKATAESVCRRIGALETLIGDDEERGERRQGGREGERESLELEMVEASPLLSSSLSSSSSSPSLGYRSLTALEFEALPPQQQSIAIQHLALFSRVEPAHKSMLVDYLKKQNEVVAMTGDGVNDAPALKKADIGIAMGSGTAVAKGASDMVLADDNFSSIVAAISEGRSIFNNMKQFIRYMVSSNIGEVVCIFVGAALGMPDALVPVQLLWVNLVTDGLPATALGFNKQDTDVMKCKPRKLQDSIVNKWLFCRYLIVGVYVGLATVSGFLWWYILFPQGPMLTWKQLVTFDSCTDISFFSPDSSSLFSANSTRHSHSLSLLSSSAVFSDPTSQLTGFGCEIFSDVRPKTIAMSVLVVVEMFNALNNLSENQSLLTLPPWSNPWLLAAIFLSVALHLLILYVQPLALLFSVGPLSLSEWWMVLVLSFPVVLLDELLKFVSRRTNGNGFLIFSPLFPSKKRIEQMILPKLNGSLQQADKRKGAGEEGKSR